MVTAKGHQMLKEELYRTCRHHVVKHSLLELLFIKCSFRDSAGPDIALVEVSTALILYKTAFSQQQQILMWKTEQIMSVDDVVEFCYFSAWSTSPKRLLKLNSS